MLLREVLYTFLPWFLTSTQAQEEAAIQYSPEFSDPIWKMPITFHSRDAIWTTARYDQGGVVIAHGLASVVTHRVQGQTGYLNQDFVSGCHVLFLRVISTWRARLIGWSVPQRGRQMGIPERKYDESHGD